VQVSRALRKLGRICDELDEQQLVVSRAERRDELTQLEAEADDAAPHARPAASHLVEVRVAPEDRAFELLQRRRRLDAELIHEETAAFAVARERIGLPPGAIQGEHQLPARAFAQRFFFDQRLELADETVVMSELELRVDALLERGEAKLRETS